MQKDVWHTTRYIYVFTDECLFMSYYLVSTVSAEKQINLYKLKFIKHIAKIMKKDTKFARKETNHNTLPRTNQSIKRANCFLSPSHVPFDATRCPALF